MLRVSFAFFLLASLIVRAEEPIPAGELLQLDGKEFEKAAEEASFGFYGDKCPYDAPQLLAIAERLAKTVKGFRDRDVDHSNPFVGYFTMACARADDGQQLDRLVEIYSQLPCESFEKIRALPDIATRCISREVKEIRAEHLHATLDKTEPAVPIPLRQASNGLQRASRLYHRVLSGYEKEFPKDGAKEQIAAYANQKTFYGLVDAALRGTDGIAGELFRYVETGANCLDVRDVDDAKDIGMLLTLLHERKLDLALGAALRVANSGGSTSSPEMSTEAVIQLFEVAGVDWEAAFVGAVAHASFREWGPGNKVPLLTALAKYGSERSAFLVIELAELVKPDSRGLYVGAFKSWVKKSEKLGTDDGEVKVGYDFDNQERKLPVTAAMHKAALRTTEKFVTQGCSENLASVALEVFKRSLSPSSVPALQTLVSHYSADVATTANGLLANLGIKTTVQSPGVVRFQILINGKPIPTDLSVGWTVMWRDGGTGSSKNANAEGIVELERKYFADPAKPLTQVLLSAVGESVESARFTVGVPSPRDISTVILVNIEASPLTIELGNMGGLNAPPAQEASVEIKRAASDEAYAVSFGPEVKVSALAPIVFPRVQNGTYNVSISVPGASVWQGTARVGPGEPPTQAMLQPGSDVKVKVVTPSGEPAFSGRLFKDGEQFAAKQDIKTDAFLSLPCGNYVLRIPGSEFMQQYRDEKKLVRGPDEIAEIPFAGRDVAFTVEHGSPALIDLGEIRLEKAER